MDPFQPKNHPPEQEYVPPIQESNVTDRNSHSEYQDEDAHFPFQDFPHPVQESNCESSDSGPRSPNNIPQEETNFSALNDNLQRSQPVRQPVPIPFSNKKKNSGELQVS